MTANTARAVSTFLETPSKSAQFRRLLDPGELSSIMEAHNGLSARIVEETGFKGIWASGLSISAALGVRDVTVVRGYCKEAIDLPSIQSVDNDDYADTGELASLYCARDALEGDCVVSYGDVLFREHMLDTLLRADGDIVIVADALWRQREQSAEGLVRDLIVGDRPFSTDYLDDAPVRLVRAGRAVDLEEATGEWVGMLKLTGLGSTAVKAELTEMKEDGCLRDSDVPVLLNRLIAKGQDVRVQYITGQWLDIDDALDLARARNSL